MASDRYYFTVFTPTYNRAHTLGRVYQSLCAQGFRDFEWLIVDDGSTDDTGTRVRGWQVEAPFPIRYLYKENGGKHTAMNLGAREAQGMLFLTLDSDDACTPDALAVFREIWESIPEQQRDGFSGATSLCVDEQGRMVGDRFPGDVLDSNSLEVRHRYKVKGEKWGFQRTDVMRRFPFPEPSRRLRHVPEGIVWSRIARHYQTRYFNRALRIYFQDDPANSLVRGTLRGHTDGSVKSGFAGFLEHQEILNHHLDWFRHDPGCFIRSAIHYTRFALHARVPLRDFSAGVTRAGARMLVLLCALAGAIVYGRDCARGVGEAAAPGGRRGASGL